MMRIDQVDPVVAEHRQSAMQLGLCVLIVLVLLHTALEAVWAGWYCWLPGGLSRSRDAEAVAITAVAYGKWQGYASYRAVNRTLREHGLSVQQEDLARVGATHYFDVMTDPKLLDAALKAASTLDAPAAEGMYYSQDEKGAAAFYIIAFALFGIASASWYWLYMALYSLSVLAACVAFHRRSEVLFFLLAVVCTHELVAQLLPTIPRQDLNLIHASRFLGIMASVAMFHLMFLILQRKRPTTSEIAAAALQTGIICLTVNARTSAAWLLIAVMLLWAMLWLMWLFRRARTGLQAPKPTSWPMGVLALGLAGLLLHQQFGQDPAFHDSRAQGGHVFWHNIVTTLHNNPLHTGRYGIPAEFPVYDDQVSYLLFDREVARRGEERSKYLMGDSDWVYRTSSPDLDFRWVAYDRVLRDVFVRTVASDPWYAIYSFLAQQPRSAVTIVFGRDFLRSRALLDRAPFLALIFGVLLIAANIPLRPATYVPVLAFASFGVVLPVLCAAVAELRVVEMFYILLLAAIVGVAVVAAVVGRLVLVRLRRRGTA